MSIRVGWDNDEKTILNYVYEGRWTWDELYTAVAEASHLLDMVDDKVDVIIDVSQSTIIPPSALSHARSLLRHPHPNEGIKVIVGASRVLQVMYDMAKRVYPKMMESDTSIFVPTLEQAYALIAEQRRQREGSAL